MFHAITKRQIDPVGGDVKVRILHVDHSEEFGGAELALAKMLGSRVPWDAVLLLPRRGRGWAGHPAVFEKLSGAAVRVARAGPPVVTGATSTRSVRGVARFAWNIALQACTVTLVANRLRPDFIWANSSRAALYSALAPRRRATQLILHLRDRVDRESLGGVGYFVMTKFVLRRADGVIANSQYTMRSAAAFISPGASTIVVHSPFGLRPSPVLRVPNDDQSQPLRIGIVARLDPWKGQHLVVEAFAILREKTSRRVVLHIAGAGDFGHEEYRDRLTLLVKNLGLVEAVVFEGRVDDVNSFIDQMDICVQYSTRPEPLGQNVLQYLSRGRAVVVADEGGPVEWVEDRVNGVVVSARSAQALGEALVELVEDDGLRYSLGARALETPGLLSDLEVIAVSDQFLKTAIAEREARS